MIILANMKNEEIYITNSEGQSIKFSEDRLRSSLMKAGASLFFANEITEEIKRELKRRTFSIKVRFLKIVRSG